MLRLLHVVSHRGPTFLKYKEVGLTRASSWGEPQVTLDTHQSGNCVGVHNELSRVLSLALPECRDNQKLTLAVGAKISLEEAISGNQRLRGRRFWTKPEYIDVSILTAPFREGLGG